MKASIATLAMIMAMDVHVPPVFAQTSYAGENFTAQKLCDISRAPRGFRMIDVFSFSLADQYYRPLFDVYQSAEKMTLLVANVNDGCWLRIGFKTPALSVAETPQPFGGGTIKMEIKSRRMAEQYFWDRVDVCDQEEDNFFKELYYTKRFRQDFPISNNPEGERICFQALGYGSESMIIRHEKGSVIVDIIAGVTFFGEVK